MELYLLLTFAVTYILIVLEHPLKINKSGPALIGGVILWVIYASFSSDHNLINEELLTHIGDISEILLFLMGAMAIVELIDAHAGFEVITNKIKTRNPVSLLWIISILTFFLSAALDNLTTTIVMITLLRKLVHDKKTRLYFAGLIVIAANAGGAWSPIGDVTTTMLWIRGNITAFRLITSLFVPSLVSLIIPLLYATFVIRKTTHIPHFVGSEEPKINAIRERNFIFFLGIGLLISVPVFKTLTNLPPFMGILFGLGIFWIITEIMHRKKQEEERKSVTVAYAIQKIDLPSILFFAGILMSIAALEASGILYSIAGALQTALKSTYLINLTIGIVSSVIDNVPLVAAMQGMFSLDVYPADHVLWEFLAYCAGTGGSILIIGSAAGVAAMGMEKIDFIWYLKKFSIMTLLGYFGGALIYIFL